MYSCVYMQTILQTGQCLYGKKCIIHGRYVTAPAPLGLRTIRFRYHSNDCPNIVGRIGKCIRAILIWGRGELGYWILLYAGAIIP